MRRLPFLPSLVCELTTSVWRTATSVRPSRSNYLYAVLKFPQSGVWVLSFANPSMDNPIIGNTDTINVGSHNRKRRFIKGVCFLKVVGNAD